MCMISVVIPIYNAQEYLRQCIDSVLAQTYTDYEILLINDGSTDGSENICIEYAARYDRITTINQANSGPAASRKKGVAIANGDYIVFVDADDHIDSTMLEFFMREMGISGADVVACGYEDFYPNGKRVHRNNIESAYIDIDSYEDCIRQIHENRNLLCVPYCKLIKKSLFEGINWYEEVTIGEDYSMCLELFRNADKIRIKNVCLYYRRMSGTNISRSGYTDRHKKALDNYINVRNMLISEFPALKKGITGYHVEYEMAVITAMCRNGHYDKQVLKELKYDVRSNLWIVLICDKVPLTHKISATIIAVSPLLFILLFRPFHIITGR